jgi:tRNA threonylcarbamoyladenosine biosynthesis protein TsaE
MDMMKEERSGTRTTLVLISNHPDETFRIGRTIGQGLKRGDCVALTGELGAGKTCLTQGIAAGIGVPECYCVTSPTFTLVNEYPGREMPLHHVDVYRLDGTADLGELGYDEFLTGHGVTVIEWAEKVADAVPGDALRIELTYTDETVRRIEITDCPEKIASWERTLKQGGR